MSDIGLLLNNEFKFVKTEDSKGKVENSTKDNSNSSKLKVLGIVFFVVLFLICIEFFVYKFFLPSVASPKITVSGQKNYTPQEIASLLIPMNCTSWFDFDVEQAVSLICTESGIDDVIVEKSFPDKIYVNVIERKPVAITFVVEDGFSIPMQIDRSGVLFPLKDKSVLQTNVLPVISGLPIEHMASGMRIPPKYKTLMQQISNIQNKNANYFTSIAEICVIPKDSGNYELALIPVHSKIRVLTDRALNEDAIKYMMLVLDVVNLLDTEVTEIDLRYGSVSCKIKEEVGLLGNE